MSWASSTLIAAATDGGNLETATLDDGVVQARPGQLQRVERIAPAEPQQLVDVDAFDSEDQLPDTVDVERLKIQDLDGGHAS